MRRFSRPTHTVGHPPGTLKPTSTERAQPVTVRRFAYDETSLHEDAFDTIEALLEAPSPDLTTWIDVHGVHDAGPIERIGRRFELHPLMLEDIAHAVQRSKVEQYGGKTYIVVRLLEFDAGTGEVQSRQISMVLTGDTLITFQERSTGVFDGVRARIRDGRLRMRTSGVPYLVYALLDAVVDRYFVLLEKLGEHMEALEEELLSAPDQETLNAIHRLKRELIYLRKSVWPLREALNTMLRDEALPFDPQMHVYLRDLYDHTVQVMETIESYRDLNAGMLETYLSMVSNRMNEVMKTLTVIATLFIPLTFLVGVYGMNFEHMPELHWRWAYPAIWLLMIAVSVLMLRYFKRKGWF